MRSIIPCAMVLTLFLAPLVCADDTDLFYQRLYKNGTLRYDDLWNDVSKQYYDFLDEVANAQFDEPYVSVTRFSDVKYRLIDWCGDLFDSELAVDSTHGISKSLYQHIFAHLNVTSMCLYCNKASNTSPQHKVVTYSNGRKAEVNTVNRICHCSIYDIILNEQNDTIIGVSSVQYNPCAEEQFTDYLTAKPGTIMTSVQSLSLLRLPVYELRTSFLSRYPNLQIIVLTELPLSNLALPDKFLCGNSQLRSFSFLSSLGNLREFPLQIFRCFHELTLSCVSFNKHDFAYLPAYAMGNASASLRILILKQVGLESIDPLAFYGLTSLQFLHMEGNKLTEISVNWMPANLALQFVGIAEELVSQTLNLTNLSVVHYPQLKIFQFTESNCSQIVGSFCSEANISSLELVQLMENLFTGLPEDLFHHCSSLRYLDLTGNELDYLQADLFDNVTKLETLDLAYNKLSDNVLWTALLENQTQLVYLNLSNNILTSWTQGLVGLDSLQQLDLSWNQISQLSTAAFDKLTKLKYLNLERNYLENTVSFSANHGSLSALLLGYNYLSGDGIDNITALTQFQVLDVSMNCISSLSIPKSHKGDKPNAASVFAHMNQLTTFTLTCSFLQQYATVNVSHNNITDFYGIFSNHVDTPCIIEALDASHNPLRDFTNSKKFDEYVIKDNLYGCQRHSIRALYLRHCEIIFIDAGYFAYFNLELLDLRNNNLMVVSEMRFPFMGVVDLRNNIIQCNCSYLWLKQRIEEQTPRSSSQFMLTECREVLSQESVPIQSVPDLMFLCQIICPQVVHAECVEPRCYSNKLLQKLLDAVLCSASHNQSVISSSAFPHTISNLQLMGFHMQRLHFPYKQPSNLVYFNATLCGIRTIPDDAFINTPKLKHLLLADNNIETISMKSFWPVKWLEVLDLSANQLVAFQGDLILPLRLLQQLSLHSNRLSTLDASSQRSLETVRKLSLSSNPWLCNCSLNQWMLRLENLVHSKEDLRCMDQTGSAIPLGNVTCEEPQYVKEQHFLLVALCGSLAALLSVSIVVGVIGYRHRFFLTVAIHTYLPVWCCCWWQRQSQGQERGEADCVFAIYDDQYRRSYMWVREHLIPNLEPDCRIICYDRDFEPGVDMMDNIEDAVAQSTCALLFLTPGFLGNMWTRAMCDAVSIALKEQAGRGRAGYRIILVFDDEEKDDARTLKKLLMNHYMCSADMRVILKTCLSVRLTQRLFWQSVHYLLPNSHTTAHQPGRSSLISRLTWRWRTRRHANPVEEQPLDHQSDHPTNDPLGQGLDSHQHNQLDNLLHHSSDHPTNDPLGQELDSHQDNQLLHPSDHPLVNQLDYVLDEELGNEVDHEHKLPHSLSLDDSLDDPLLDLHDN